MPEPESCVPTRSSVCLAARLTRAGWVGESSRRVVTDAVARTELTALRQRISVLCPGFDPASVHTAAHARRVLTEQATEEVGFLQFINLHHESPEVRTAMYSES